MYLFTNEDLGGIIAGMNLSSADDVLAIAGSGDQAFAMLEFAGTVQAVDSVEMQIKLMKMRAKALKDGDYEAFLWYSGSKYSIASKFVDYHPERLKNRDCYFNEEGRLEKIRGNLPCLSILRPRDILTAAKKKGFSKVYLSNALYYSHNNENVFGILEGIARNMSKGGLIYITNSNDVRGSYLPHELSFDVFLSDLARTNELGRDKNLKWEPAVYRIR